MSLRGCFAFRIVNERLAVEPYVNGLIPLQAALAEGGKRAASCPDQPAGDSGGAKAERGENGLCTAAVVPRAQA